MISSAPAISVEGAARVEDVDWDEALERDQALGRMRQQRGHEIDDTHRRDEHGEDACTHAGIDRRGDRRRREVGGRRVGGRDADSSAADARLGSVGAVAPLQQQVPAEPDERIDLGPLRRLADHESPARAERRRTRRRSASARRRGGRSSTPRGNAPTAATRHPGRRRQLDRAAAEPVRGIARRRRARARGRRGCHAATR